jgi:hypothetical protein
VDDSLPHRDGRHERGAEPLELRQRRGVSLDVDSLELQPERRE